MKEELDCFLMLRNLNYVLRINSKYEISNVFYVLIAIYIVYTDILHVIYCMCIWSNMIRRSNVWTSFGCIKMAKIINSKSLYKNSGSITLDKNGTAYIYIYLTYLLSQRENFAYYNSLPLR